MCVTWCYTIIFKNLEQNFLIIIIIIKENFNITNVSS